MTSSRTAVVRDGLDAATAAEFDRLRPYLLRVADGHLGSLSEAEDVVQDSWLRLAGTQRETIRDLRAWLTTVVSRLAVDALTSAQARREQYVGAWLPEQLAQDDAGDRDPARRLDLDESVRMALLVVIESLSPAERSALVAAFLMAAENGDLASLMDLLGDSPQRCARPETRDRPLAERRSSHARRAGRRTRLKVTPRRRAVSHPVDPRRHLDNPPDAGEVK
jgi:RNA polymerase sigma-70 factor, ECF subfamily